MSIGWNRKLKPPPNYPDIPEAKLVACRETRQLQAVDKVKPVIDSSKESDRYNLEVFELDALEIKFVDELKEEIDLEFSWDIVEFTSEGFKL